MSNIMRTTMRIAMHHELREPDVSEVDVALTFVLPNEAGHLLGHPGQPRLRTIYTIGQIV